MIKAVIFDMDGVIIDSEGVYLEYQLEFAKKKNPDVKLEDLYPLVGATKQECWEVVERVVSNGQTWEELRNEFRQRDIYSEIDYRNIYRPEVTDTLKQLKDAGFRLALASSTHLELVERVLEENGIRDYFEAVVSGEQFKKSKPDPEIYLYTAGQLKLEPGECLAVEDSTIGITAAHRAGLKIAAVIDTRYGFDQSLADYKLNTVKDVLEAVKVHRI
ncbi:HAD superfamily hydrolase (TIGR01509 family)/HAD superfamily hydrolase (TIGR01549 family) [Lacrimispora xylanisolvens]|uniref:HAD superfamily hydrolase (TIGR01509 family)/HAD superfamily hydrolase (TIGR01549 family) n=1 Tax=Lacrimispora xylanisolvens TaxID=384636 RepID=A0A2S6HTD4_9FIRM|nr:HAD family phosphatase [Hungatella xylanolytica]PPK80920.1 HAD superfamily hydrolase (TIGR01509 family)/HAD superfamily hydrolase (TIGR01549 family) [Hungatella xylanolytica]